MTEKPVNRSSIGFLYRRWDCYRFRYPYLACCCKIQLPINQARLEQLDALAPPKIHGFQTRYLMPEQPSFCCFRMYLLLFDRTLMLKWTPVSELRLFMGMTAVKWSLEDYHRLVATGILDERRVELLWGDLIEMAPEGEVHAYASDEAGEYLARVLGDRARVRQAKPITLPNQSEPEPDLAIVQRLGRAYLNHHPYPENIYWVIEYSRSTLEKDLTIKSKIYAEVGIPEYWVVDLNAKILVLFREPQDGIYTVVTTLDAGTIRPLAFPEIELSIDLILGLT